MTDFDAYPSKLLNNAVLEFSKLPGVGDKTALRLALYMLKMQEEDVKSFGNNIIALRTQIKYCSVCNTISDEEICDICSDKSRDQSTVCVVESIREVMAIESTRQYRGLYHVLGGIISPMEGVGPSDLNIDKLQQRLESGKIKELILALSTTMEGDTTGFYLYKKFGKYSVEITTLARGMGIGDEIEYTDEITLARSLTSRTRFTP